MTEKTDARKIMEARHGSYANYPEGMIDETDLLLMQQDYSERSVRKGRRWRERNRRKQQQEG
jgi:hypothetical protein